MREDPYLLTRNHDVSVEVGYWSDLRTVTPMIEHLGRHFGDVRTRTTYPVPYSGGTTSIDWNFVTAAVLTFTAAGGVDFVRQILGELAKDTYRDLRREILRAWKRRWTHRRIKRGVVIQIGSHRFVFDQKISEAEFQRQLRAAQVIMDRSPEPLLLPDDPDDESRPWLWHKGRWRTTGVRLSQAVGEEPRVID